MQCFAPKTEKLASRGELAVFNEGEQLCGASDDNEASAPDAAEIKVPAHSRTQGKRNPIDAALPRVRRDECLSVEWFRTREEARVLIGKWRRHYHEERPHSALGNLTPTAYAAKLAASEIAPHKRRSHRPATGQSAACIGHSAARPVDPPETLVQCA